MEKQPDTIGTPGEHGTERASSATVHVTHTAQGFMARSIPKRIQRSRAKGWRMPAGAVYVGRPSKWGNPFDVTNTGRVPAVLRFACEVAPLMDVSELRGKDLACWCGLGDECHADILLDLANAHLDEDSDAA